MKEALFYEKSDAGKVKCFLCAHGCLISPGQRGICAVRENRDGILYSLVYGKIIAENIDPVEKKPLYHFLPGSKTYSLATCGCNLKCQHCQNYEISQYPSERAHMPIPGRDVEPSEIADSAVRYGCESISYTYTEPTIYLEYALDCINEAKKKKVRNIFVSNGFMSPESAGFVAPLIDANNIDLKGDDRFYRKLCMGRLEPVKETIRIMKKNSVWVEVTTLIIPDYNDSDKILGDIAGFIHALDPGIPWHVSAFYPTYKLMDKPGTPLETLLRARRIGLDSGLRYVYIGNAIDEAGESTFCPSCGNIVLKRRGFSVLSNSIKEGKCPVCGFVIDGVWNQH